MCIPSQINSGAAAQIATQSAMIVIETHVNDVSLTPNFDGVGGAVMSVTWVPRTRFRRSTPFVVIEYTHFTRSELREVADTAQARRGAVRLVSEFLCWPGQGRGYCRSTGKLPLRFLTSNSSTHRLQSMCSLEGLVHRTFERLGQSVAQENHHG
jgi:hypothetical protein